MLNSESARDQRNGLLVFVRERDGTTENSVGCFLERGTIHTVGTFGSSYVYSTHKDSGSPIRRKTTRRKEGWREEDGSLIFV